MSVDGGGTLVIAGIGFPRSVDEDGSQEEERTTVVEAKSTKCSGRDRGNVIQENIVSAASEANQQFSYVCILADIVGIL